MPGDVVRMRTGLKPSGRVCAESRGKRRNVSFVAFNVVYLAQYRWILVILFLKLLHEIT